MYTIYSHSEYLYIYYGIYGILSRIQPLSSFYKPSPQLLSEIHIKFMGSLAFFCPQPIPEYLSIKVSFKIPHVKHLGSWPNSWSSEVSNIQLHWSRHSLRVCLPNIYLSFFFNIPATWDPHFALLPWCGTTTTYLTFSYVAQHRRKWTSPGKANHKAITLKGHVDEWLEYIN